MDVTNAEETVAVVAEQTKTMLHLDELAQYFTWANLMKVVTSVVAILIFYLVYRLIKRAIKSKAVNKFEKHTVTIINKIVSYAFYILIGMYILSLS